MTPAISCLLLLFLALAPARPALAWGHDFPIDIPSLPGTAGLGEGEGEGEGSSPGKGGRKVKRALYVFGDSTVDTGNNNYFPNLLNASSDPYGIDYIPRSGRWCNGRIVTDFLAMYMGIPTPPPNLSRPRNPRYGVNFASSGAGICNITNVNQTIPLLRQLEYFQDFASSQNLSPQELGQAVFFVSVGGDDLLERFRDYRNAAPLPIFLAEMVTGYVRFIETLFSLGARRFLLTNIPDLGCVPAGATFRALVAPKTAGTAAGCNPVSSALSRALNKALAPAKAALELALRAQAGQDLLIANFNSFRACGYIHDNAQELGFVSTFACCGGPPPTNGLVICNRTVKIGGISIGTTLCKHHDRYVFWDLVHLSQQGNYYMTKWMWTNSSLTTPITASRLIE